MVYDTPSVIGCGLQSKPQALNNANVELPLNSKHSGFCAQFRVKSKKNKNKPNASLIQVQNYAF